LAAAFMPGFYKELKIPAKKVTAVRNFNFGGEYSRLLKNPFYIKLFKNFSKPGMTIAYVLS
jgi:hypothetical protein